MTPEQFCKHYPCLYHMAEPETWESICKHGLLSTSALLDLFEITGSQRKAIESNQRRHSVTLSHPKYGEVTVRDQGPLPETKLLQCLQGQMSPMEWYETLNANVFFWATYERLLGFLRARAYRGRRHTVITVDTRALVARHVEEIRLSGINSGAAVYRPVPRGRDTFCRLASWPSAEGPRTGRLKSAVAEVAMPYGVYDIVDIATKVEERQAGRIIRTIWSPPRRPR